MREVRSRAPIKRSVRLFEARRKTRDANRGHIGAPFTAQEMHQLAFGLPEQWLGIISKERWRAHGAAVMDEWAERVRAEQELFAAGVGRPRPCRPDSARAPGTVARDVLRSARTAGEVTGQPRPVGPGAGCSLPSTRRAVPTRGRRRAIVLGPAACSGGGKDSAEPAAGPTIPRPRPVRPASPPRPGPSRSCGRFRSGPRYETATRRVSRDGGISVALPDGRALWLFGDTGIYEADPGRAVERDDVHRRQQRDDHALHARRGPDRLGAAVRGARPLPADSRQRVSPRRQRATVQLRHRGVRGPLADRRDDLRPDPRDRHLLDRLRHEPERDRDGAGRGLGLRALQLAHRPVRRGPDGRVRARAERRVVSAVPRRSCPRSCTTAASPSIPWSARPRW